MNLQNTLEPRQRVNRYGASLLYSRVFLNGSTLPGNQSFKYLFIFKINKNEELTFLIKRKVAPRLSFNPVRFCLRIPSTNDHLQIAVTHSVGPGYPPGSNGHSWLCPYITRAC